MWPFKSLASDTTQRKSEKIMSRNFYDEHYVTNFKCSELRYSTHLKIVVIKLLTWVLPHIYTAICPIVWPFPSCTCKWLSYQSITQKFQARGVISFSSNEGGLCIHERIENMEIKLQYVSV